MRQGIADIFSGPNGASTRAALLAIAKRLARVVARRLEGRAYLVGEYSIADIASFPWLARHERLGIDLDDLPNLRRWLAAIAERPSVRRGLEPVA